MGMAKRAPKDFFPGNLAITGRFPVKSVLFDGGGE